MPEEGPPPDHFTRARWVRPEAAEWAIACNKILLEYGAVTGRTVYRRHHLARWRARRLINLMVELKLHERWQLAEHADRKDDGWIWTVEYRGGPHVRPAPTSTRPTDPDAAKRRRAA